MKNALTLLLLIGSVSLNVVLAHKLSRFNHPLRAEPLQVGATVPSFKAADLHQQMQTISYERSNPTVFYIFSPPCSWCARNLDNLKTLVNRDGLQFRFIGVSLSEQGLAEYVAKNDLRLPIYSGLSPETLNTYKLGSTPQTIVISAEGKVLKDWIGAYVGEQKSQVEAFFHVSLPGLREPQKADAVKN